MKNPEYVYVAAIAAPPEAVWKALTTPEFTCQYWHKTRVESEFHVDSDIRFYVEDGEVGCEGVVLAADYPEKLSYTWRFPRNPDTRDEPPSRVTFLLERIDQGTKLTVIHDRFTEGSKTYELVAGGWPLVISGLKTLLESSSPVDFSVSGSKA